MRRRGVVLPGGGSLRAVMPLSRWVGLIALVVGLGCLKVSERNAVFLNGLAVGDGMSRVHARETAVSWLSVEVAGLASPARLARVAQERRLNLVAWSAISASTPTPLTHVASLDDTQAVTDGGSADSPISSIVEDADDR